MKAIEVHQYGGPEVLQQEEVPPPMVNPDDVLVKVYASGVNPVDLKVCEGHFAHELPFIPGWDVSGVVEEAGPEAKGFDVGDEVYGRPDIARDGSYAEYIVVRSSELGHKPRSIDHVTAAAIPLAGLTAWQGIFEHGELDRGQRIFIHGASGGVGHFAVQFASWRGAYVIGAASAGNLSFLKELGADVAVDYTIPDFESQFTNTLDIVFDTVGGNTQKRSLKMLKPGGILVTTVKIEDVNAFEDKGVHITSMFTQSKKKDLDAIARLVDDGKVRPVVSEVFALEEAREAQLRLKEGHVRGKIVLKVR